MIRNPTAYSFSKSRWLAAQDLSLDDKYRILEALHGEARRFGSFGERDTLLGIDDDIRLAAALNANVPGAAR